MNNDHWRLALLHWVTAEEGGRQSPFLGDTYHPIIHVSGDASWPDAMWSARVQFIDRSEDGRTALVEVFFFNTVDAPIDLLYAGNTFSLYEGNRQVATGEILHDHWRPLPTHPDSAQRQPEPVR